MVKANAYGHGALSVTQLLIEQSDVRLVAVATLEEARELSEKYPNLDILIFSRVFPAELTALPKNAIVTVTSLEDYLALEAKANKLLRVHINVNTGMNRLGMAPETTLDIIKRSSKYLQIEGVYSHFSSSDTTDPSAFRHQQTIFDQFCSALNDLGFEGMRHLSNSAGILRFPNLACDAMRLGIGLYGYDTTPEQKYAAQLRPVMTVKAPLVRVAAILSGESVSYGETWKSTVSTQIGTLRIGYADGYRRSLSNRGIVNLENLAFPVIGTVSMDHIMIDLQEAEIQTGKYFTVLGGAFGVTSIATVARQLKTIPYEICCGISPRVERVYIND